MNFAQNLKKLRKARNLTQVEFAKQVGITQSAVTAYENGVKKPEMNRLPTIANVLGVSIDELLGVSPENLRKAVNKAHGNKRVSKLQNAFEKLKPAEQRFVLMQIEGMLAKR